jgi:hypothetical protein
VVIIYNQTENDSVVSPNGCKTPDAAQLSLCHGVAEENFAVNSAVRLRGHYDEAP